MCDQFYRASDKFVFVKPQTKRPKSIKRRGQDILHFRPSPTPNQFCFERWLQQYDEEKINILESAKLTETMNQVRDCLHKTIEENDKIIVFSQFRQFQIMLGAMLAKENIMFVYFSVRIVEQA
jgi:SNF2 family DNA or RNA helicase